MKMRIASFSLLTIACLMLAVAPAMADILYSNGPYTGEVTSWTFNFGFSVSDSFNLAGGSSATGLDIVTWNFPGDTLLNVELQSGGSHFTNNYADLTGLVPSSSVDLGILNDYGYELWEYTFTFTGISLPSGSSFMTLQNAATFAGNPIYWDQNAGLSEAYQFHDTDIEHIPSESFTITGSSNTTTPELGSITLVGSGILALAGVLRRKLTR